MVPQEAVKNILEIPLALGCIGTMEQLVAKQFKVGDHVRWNSEAGVVSGTVTSKVTAGTLFKGYVHHASEAEPRYLIQSDKTDYVAMHKGDQPWRSFLNGE